MLKTCWQKVNKIGSDNVIELEDNRRVLDKLEAKLITIGDSL